jgi:CelD/BcsL family acetyltransferase involved in cellulose biosynthesis
VHVAKSSEELHDHAEHWNALVERKGFLHTSSAAWLIPFVATLTTRHEQCNFMFLYRGDRLAAVLPLLLTSHRTPFGTSRRIQTPNHPHALSVDILVDEREIDALAQVLPEVFRGYLRHWFELKVCRITGESVLFELTDAPRDSIYRLDTVCDYGAYVPTTGSFDRYLDSLSNRFSRNLRRLQRKLEKLDDVQYLFLRGSEARPELLEDFVRVEASGWKGARGTAIASDERLVSFYRRAVENLFREGWLEWHLLKTGHHVIAAQLGVRMNRTLHLWKIAFDEEFSAFGPGNLLLRECIRRCFLEPDIDTLNCITDMPWNRNWSMTRQEYRTIECWPRSFRTFALGYLPARGREIIKKVPVLRIICRCLRDAMNNRHSHGAEK